MLGILCEKPSALKNFSKALGAKEVSEGKLRYAKGTYAGEDFVLVAARGHLYELAQPEEQVPAALQSELKSWSLKTLPWDETQFAWKKKAKPDVKAELALIKRELSRCDEIAIATDVDPTGEGNLLAWEILDGLKFRPKKWSRFFFIDESAPEIQKAFKTRKSLGGMLQDPDYLKAAYRDRWDFLSMQFTRIATLNVPRAKLMVNGKTRSLRNGRLKSAMVVLVGDQLQKVNAYQKIPFYQNRFKDENGVVYTDPKEPQFPDKNQVPRQYQPSAVVLDSKTTKYTAPPKLMDLAALSARLAPRGFKSKAILDTYQKMYEAQVVSYPRTEDKVISPEQFKELLPLVNKIAAVVGVDPALLTHRTARSTHVKAGGAHGANRPGTNVPTSLTALSAYDSGASGLAAAIYTILAMNYLAMLAEDYEYEAQKGHVADYPSFVGSANVPKKPGWRAVFQTDDDDGDEDVAAGLGTRAEPFVHEGFPPKPQWPTQKWLMDRLAEHDVGTGATRVSTYSDVTTVSTGGKLPLLKDDRGRLSLTEHGEINYTLLPGTHIGSLALTEEVQRNMRDIAAGKTTADKLLTEVSRLVVEDMQVMAQNAAQYKQGGTTVSYQDKEKYEGTWRGQDISFFREMFGYRFSDDECEALCNGESVTGNFVSKDGAPYQRNVVLGKTKSSNGKEYVNIVFDVPDDWCQHRFTEDEKDMLRAGKKVALSDCVSAKSGKTFSCKVSWQKNDKGYMALTPIFD